MECFSKPMKKNNSVLHWEKQQKAKISQKSHCCIFGTCKDVLANGVFVLKYQHLQFGSLAAARFIPFLRFMDCRSPLSQVQPKLPVPRRAGRDRRTLVCRTHCHLRYRSLLEDCAVHVLKPRFSFKPHWHSHLPRSSLWFPGVTGSFSPTSTQPQTLPKATGLRKPGTSREQAAQLRAAEPLLKEECIYSCSTWRRWIEIYLCVINSELQLTDIFYMNAIYYVITSLCLYNEINCFCEVNYPDLFFASS